MKIILMYWPVISFLIIQAIGFVWMMAGLAGRIRHIEEQLEHYRNVHERLAKLEAMSVSVAESVRRIEAHLLRTKRDQN